MIERASPVPYYEQLFEILRDRITAGEFRPDERLPSELELCRDFGLSRATVRQTMSRLESDGFAYRVPRRGVFASAPGRESGWIIQDDHGFLESQIRHGRTGITTEVVGAQRIVPPAHVAEALKVAAADEVFALDRVRSLDGRIAMFSTNWFPHDVGQKIASASDVIGGTGSVNNTLRRAGYITAGAQRVIHSLAAPAQIAEHLGVDEATPVLRVRSLSWNADQLMFDYYETWVLTDVIPLEVNVAAN